MKYSLFTCNFVNTLPIKPLFRISSGLQLFSTFFFSAKNRTFTHLTFWILYYCYRVYIYSYVSPVNTFWNVVIVQFLELGVKIGMAYFNLYVLMPFLLKKDYAVFYGLSLILGFHLATILQLEIIRICIYLDIYDFPVRKLYWVSKYLPTMFHIIEIVFVTMIFKTVRDAYRNQRKNQELEREKLSSELRFLKTQLNPHFFFNTLNNLYALILLKSDLAAEVVLKLSGLMSYVLYESDVEKVRLEKEIKFLNDYIELEKLRFGDEMNVLFEVNGKINEKHIPPLLLIPLLENSFKHGKGQEGGSFQIKAKLSILDKQIDFVVSNSINKERAKEEGKQGGIGLANLKRRLDLLYPNRYHLETEEKGGLFLTHLSLPLT